MNHLLCFGFGYTAEVLAGELMPLGWRVSGTTRNPTRLNEMRLLGVNALPFGMLKSIPSGVTHILSSVPPDANGDPVIPRFMGELIRHFSWIAYLSTTGVYGDRAGGWVGEDSALSPVSERGTRRMLAEQGWLQRGAHIFRLPGIYGPGRNALDTLREGKAKRVIKPGQIFSRIHVEDIAGLLGASIAKPNPGRIYNVADDEPCPPQDVITYAAKLLGISPPPEIPIAEANLSPMALSFYDESKRVSNQRMKQELGYQLRYPSYREGLEAILKNSPHLHAPPD